MRVCREEARSLALFRQQALPGPLCTLPAASPLVGAGLLRLVHCVLLAPFAFVQ